MKRVGFILMLLGLIGCWGGQTTSTTQEKTVNSKSSSDLKKRLTPLQHKVTQEAGTEPAFNNEYWDHHEPGIYVDIVDGSPLFSSIDKYDSKSGWPSFTRPIEKEEIAFKKDKKLFTERTEVMSKGAGSHLGHVFDDGPEDRGGLRYCINSSALRFVHLKDMKAEGYGHLVSQFPADQVEKFYPKTLETAILAGGCFWGVEDLIRKIPGVVSTDVGYTGGSTEQPIYEEVKSGSTGHAEAVKIQFDPAKVKYETLLDHFFKLHDPTTLNRQGNDIGSQYRSVIFYESEDQKKTALAKIKEWNASGKWKKPIVTEVAPLKTFYLAESDHQDYLVKNPQGYTCHYYRDF